MSEQQPRNRAERRRRRRVHRDARVRAWKRTFGGVIAPRDVIAVGRSR